MIDPITGGILIAAVLATIWLVFYVHSYLPRKMEQRFLESMKAFSTSTPRLTRTNISAISSTAACTTGMSRAMIEL